jgi:hypothetical protein
MQVPDRWIWGRCAATVLALHVSAGCSGGNTNPTNRNLGTRDAEAEAGEEPESDAAFVDAAAEDAEAAAADTEDATLADGASEAAQPPLDAHVGLDASTVDAAVDEVGPEDVAAPTPDTSLVEAAVDADAQAPESGVQPGATPATGYLRPQDSPFASVDFAWFYLEDFEDHQLNTLGLLSLTAPGSSTAAGVLSSSFGAGLVDSVDADDGRPDDMTCMKTDGNCDAWWGPGALTFSFDVALLGALPTHVGGVWTDGAGQVSFEAFGPDGTSIYEVGPVSEPGIFPDSTFNSSTGEDRFFGAYHPQGISAFTLSNTAGGVEIDHVQYGRAR